MAISAIPTGLPALVSALFAAGAKNLAQAKAVVKNLTDVEALGVAKWIRGARTPRPAVDPERVVAPARARAGAVPARSAV
jgi:hypothetical protein